MKALSALVVLLLLAARLVAAEPVRVLIFSGQNNHDWKATTPALKKVLVDAGRFTVEVNEHPERCTAATLARFDVVLSNWNTFGNCGVKDWPAETQRAYLDFVRSGKGTVSVHAGSSSFYDWPEYQQIAGASWKLGQTSHNAPHTFTVKPAAVDHPITRGMKPFTTTDELWLKPGVLPMAVVLATAEGQPVALVTSNLARAAASRCCWGTMRSSWRTPVFGDLLLRGTEWAATGRVTVPEFKSQPLNEK